MQSEEMLKALVKVYSGEALHKPFGMKLVSGKYAEIQSYLATYVACLNKHSQIYSYKTFQIPLFRAIDPQENFDINKYKLNSIK